MNRVILVVAIVLIVVLSILTHYNRTPAPAATLWPSTPTPASSPVVSPSAEPTPTVTTSPAYVFPMTRYSERKTNRWHGKQITAADRAPLPCGDTFTGYHAGDDLEVFPEEITQDVPVYAIAPGTIKQVSSVNGYGGLIVIEHTLAGTIYTAYYGHVDLANTRSKVGETVQTGQQIAILGDHCSPESSNERKHLHFALHEGTALDVRGYVPSPTDLAKWVDPTALLHSLDAAFPN